MTLCQHEEGDFLQGVSGGANAAADKSGREDRVAAALITSIGED